ncbi:hypothetical protein VD659_14980 [Herbiconiux sp. 11R-BC]|uniref:hypothetical protein n=1 Tax=Herbiconiux sp. 11R-BC TaxID=3111637 RepID=UPI003C080BA9
MSPRKFTPAVAAVVIALAVGGAIPAARASVDGDFAKGSDIAICGGNSLSTTDAQGAPLDPEALNLARSQVQNLCDAGVGSAITFEQYLQAIDDSQQFTSYANVVAQINSSPGRMGISAYANSIPRDGKTKELSCIYRMQPVAGPSTSWQGCGTDGPSTTSSYLTTRGNDFCPVKGTRWEAIADLYVNGSLKESDGDIKVAL